MKKWILVVLFLVLLTACHRTQVIKLNQPVQTYSIDSQEQPVQTIQQIVSNPQLIEQEINTETGSSNSKTNVITNQNVQARTGFNPANEYTIINCCKEGRLYAQTKQRRNSYNVEEVKQILLEIYHSNCNNFKSIREFIYLKYLDENNNRCFLIHYKNTSIKKILMDGILISNSFSVCS